MIFYLILFYLSRHFLTLQRCQNIVHSQHCHGITGFTSIAGNVRGNGNVIQGQQLVIPRQGLGIRHVQGCIGPPSTLSSSVQGIRIYHATATDINKAGSWLHLGKGCCIQHALGGGIQGNCHQHKIAGRQKLILAHISNI